MIADNIDAKFGPLPAPIHSTKSISVMHSTMITLVVQCVVCIVLLVMVQPPFVLVGPNTSDGMPSVCFYRIVGISVFTMLVTAAMYASGTHPRDTFTKTCEFLYCIT
jgi:hypothetical protein